MNAWISERVKGGLLGVGHYARSLRRDLFPGVAVLCYHGVRADDSPRGAVAFEELHVKARELEAQCRLIRDTCQPVSLDDWRRALAGGPPLPPRPVLLTFDDGYASVYTLAKPILERYRIPAVIFVCSAPVEERKSFWFDAVVRARGEAEVERMKSLGFGEWREAAREVVTVVAEDDPSRPLTVAEVQALAASPDLEIGGHSEGHLILRSLSKEMQREQIAMNKASLEAWTGKAIRAFAYPNGRRVTDYTAETVELVAESGFDFAFTTHHGFACDDEPPLERSRFLMLAGISDAELAHRLRYSWRR